MSVSTRARPHSSSTASSLLQDVPGAFPMSLSGEDDLEDESTSIPRTLSQAVYARRAEYVRSQNVRIKVGSWNVAAMKGTEKDLAGWFVGGKGIVEELAGLEIIKPKDTNQEESVADQEARYVRKEETLPKGDQSRLPSHDDVEMYVLGLQEVVDLSSAMEALRPFNDPTVVNKWKDAIAEALPEGYQLVAEQQLVGLLLLIYVAPELVKHVKSVSTTSVGTGLMGYMGNKGAVTARLVLGETTRLVFVNSHLAAGADKNALERRNWDYSQITDRTRFAPIQDAMELSQTTGEKLGEEDFAFWCGDLNYRLEGIPGDDVRRLLTLHTNKEYGLERSVDIPEHERADSVTQAALDEQSEYVEDIVDTDDPASLQTTLSSLLTHDELHQQIAAKKAFHDGWQEGPIKFMPTYKYDAGSVGVFDSSEKKRAPSWCDRILYRTRRHKLEYEAKVRDEAASKKKDLEMKANGTDLAASDEEILYDYDPDTDGHDDYDEYDDVENENVVITKEGFEDEMELEYYTSHQRVLSSDHKPLDAIFKLKFDAVIPDLKAKVHSEVAKELDKAENEGRPNVTVVIDADRNTSATTNDCPPDKFEGVWFGDVRWAQSKSRSITIANTSRVPATFTLIERPTNATNSTGIAPKWLTVTIDTLQMSSTATTTQPIKLDPGETSNIHLELRILSLDDVTELNSGNLILEDVLVLRVENGRDHFIPVRANWLDSSLGRSIDALIRIPEGGIRKLQRQRPEGGKRLSTASSSTDHEDEPVRFSAPRELFRLTEAVEECATRVIAEWEMTNPGGSGEVRMSMESNVSSASAVSVERVHAPWHEHAAWPFEEACWTERSTRGWEDALSAACNALDEDGPLDASLPSDLPRLQRLYVLSALLMMLLRTMPDRIVSPNLWSAVDKYLAEYEKAKRKVANDDQRSAIQEIFAQAPAHNISFILVASMMERMVQEKVNSAASEVPENVPLSPTRKAAGTFKRIAHIRKQIVAPQKEQIIAAYAKAFAGVMINTGGGSAEKVKAATEKRKIELIEIFLRRDELT